MPEVKNVFQRKKEVKDFDWKAELRTNVTTVEKLKEYIELSDTEEAEIREVSKIHPMNIPRYYLSLIDQDNPLDPVRKLAVPSKEELILEGSMGGTTADPYGDDKHNMGNGILHKYPYSALVVATEYCAMYCRHCFRKRMVGLPNDQTVENFRKAAEYIADHKEITNVIISGGDPMLLPTDTIIKMLSFLQDIPHLNFVRIGSRAPVVFPYRFFDSELLNFFEKFNKKKALYFPTHFNHVNEITDLSSEAIHLIRSTGTTVNNQAVFLRGVNDTVVDLENLMNGLVRIGVNPYYLYQCMPVERVRGHFQVPLKEGINTVTVAKRRLDGYAKRFKFIMGHDIGKIEIVGRKDNKLIMSQIHSRPNAPEDLSDVIIRELTETGGWLEDLPEVKL
ncbi:MAG: KamA family radical SAM protein [Spirochaetia bacterium]|nr:KamA family radical SAM protein [Spirochaetia bacterium]